MGNYGPQRQRLIKDTTTVKRWYKLYKSGTHWVIATIGATILGLVIFSTTASADEASTETATNTSVVTGTTSAPTEVAIQTTATSDAVSLVNETQYEPTDEAADTSPQAETPTTQSTTTDTPTASTENSVPIPSQSTDTATTSQTGSSVPDTVQKVIAPPQTTTQSTLATQVDNKSTSVASSGMSTKVASAVIESSVTTANAEPTAINLALTDTAIPAAAPGSLAMPVVPTFVVPAPIAANSDITPNAKFPQNYGITAIGDANNKYIYTQQADGTWVATSLGTTFNQPWSKPSYNIMATNTREIDGIPYLTAQSVLTFNVPVQLLQLPFTVAALPPMPYVWVNASLVTGDTVKLGATDSIFTNGNWSSPNQIATPATASGRLTNPITGTLSVDGTGITDEGAISWMTFRSVDLTQYRLLLGYLATKTFQLAPVITSWQAGDSVMSGTGVGAENTITIYKADGTALIRTAVDDQGNWTVNLNGFDQSQPLYVVESNDLGDLPGVTTVTQYATASRNVVFLDESGDLLRPSLPQTLAVFNDSTATITATGQVNWVTGKWQPSVPNGEFSSVQLPVIPDYYATVETVPAESFEALDPTNITKPIETLIEYNHLASWVPSEPGMAPIPYPNDPNNPSGVLDSNSPDAPGIPFIAGKTPQGPDGTPLTPKNQTDPSQGYLLPMPIDPGTPTPIQYVADTQYGTVTYQDVQDDAHPAMLGLVDTLSGDSDSTSPYTTAARIAALISQGYVLVNDGFPADGLVFDQDTTQDQAYVVTFDHGTAMITPAEPGNPGQPVDSSNPNGPTWPANSDDVTALTSTVTQTVNFIDADTGVPLAVAHVAELTFERSATVDLVTGTITPSTDWVATVENTATTPATTFDEVPSPWISGYIADRKAIAAKPDIQATDADIVETVTYSKVSAWTPTDPNLPPIPYAVDPNNPDALLPTTDSKTPVIPNIPGKTPNGPDGKPLTPVDANNLNAGFIPPTPSDPMQPTSIDYIADTQKATVTYQDVQVADEPVTLSNDDLSGDSETTSSYTTAERIKGLIGQGYVLVNDGFPAAGLVFDTDTDVDQNFIVTVTHGEAVITTQTPGNPGAPIDIDHPEGPKWPTGSDTVADLQKTVTETINYLIAGTTINVAQAHTDTVSFQQSAHVDLVTGKITPNGDWTATTKHTDGTDDTIFDTVISPAIPGYIADRATVDEITTVTQNSADVVETVTYTKVGAWTPTDPQLPPITYVVNSEKPNELLPTTDPKSPVIPNIPGKTPVGPDGKPLAPVDSANLAAGFIPPTPADPTQPTLIDYVADVQKAMVTYQDVVDVTHPITLGDVDELTGVSEAMSPYTTANRINELMAQGYVLVADGFPAAGLVFDTDATVDQAYVVTFTHGKATITTENPGQPGELIDFDEPTGPKWPIGSDNVAALSKTVTATITYVDVNGQTLAPDFSDSITFTRAGQVDLVTGVVTPAADWQVPADTTFDAVINPVILGYFTSQPTVVAVADITPNSADIVNQVIYQKLGYWVTPESGVDPIAYPNDPDHSNGSLDSTNPQAPVIPYVPGKTPQGPNGEPLTPKNPNDPIQGYVPPAPDQLNQDTMIMYVPDSDGGTDTDPDTAGETGTNPDTSGETTPNPGTGGETSTNSDTSGETTPNPGTGGETGTNPDTGGETTPNPGTGGGTDTNPGTDSETPPNPGTGGETDTNPGTNGETTPTPGTDNGTSTSPDTGNGTPPTLGTNGDVGVIPGNGNDNAIAPNPNVDGETPSVGTSLVPGSKTPQSAAPIQIEAVNPATTPVKRAPVPSVRTVTAATTATLQTKAQVNGNLPQTDESTNVLAVLGLGLLSLIGLGRFARRRKQK